VVADRAASAPQDAQSYRTLNKDVKRRISQERSAFESHLLHFQLWAWSVTARSRVTRVRRRRPRLQENSDQISKGSTGAPLDQRQCSTHNHSPKSEMI